MRKHWQTKYIMQNFDRYEVVVCKITHQKMLIRDVINKGYPDEKYNCKYHNKTNGQYEYIHKTADEIEPFASTSMGYRTQHSQVPN